MQCSRTLLQHSSIVIKKNQKDTCPKIQEFKSGFNFETTKLLLIISNEQGKTYKKK